MQKKKFFFGGEPKQEKNPYPIPTQAQSQLGCSKKQARITAHNLGKRASKIILLPISCKKTLSNIQSMISVQEEQIFCPCTNTATCEIFSWHVFNQTSWGSWHSTGKKTYPGPPIPQKILVTCKNLLLTSAGRSCLVHSAPRIWQVQELPSYHWFPVANQEVSDHRFGFNVLSCNRNQSKSHTPRPHSAKLSMSTCVKSWADPQSFGNLFSRKPHSQTQVLIQQKPSFLYPCCHWFLP